MPVNQISAIDAFDILQKDKNSVLVDVRTFEEFNFVGTVNAEEFGKRMVLNPWRLTMLMNENPAFADDLEEMLKNLFGKENKEAKQKEKKRKEKEKEWPMRTTTKFPM